MLKLKKIASQQWLGNGMGYSSADWVVAGHENIHVGKFGFYWLAIDTAHNMQRTIVRGDTRKEVMEMLTAELA